MLDTVLAKTILTIVCVHAGNRPSPSWKSQVIIRSQPQPGYTKESDAITID